MEPEAAHESLKHPAYSKTRSTQLLYLVLELQPKYGSWVPLLPMCSSGESLAFQTAHWSLLPVPILIDTPA